MTLKLNANDQTAIDLLLDQSERSRGSHNAGYAQPNHSVYHRVAPAQKLLNLLDAWEVEEPPMDLMQRTLAKIDGSAGLSALPIVGIIPTLRPNA